MKLKFTLLAVLMGVFLPHGNAYAATGESETDVSNRSQKRLGMYLAVKDPDPAILGINLAYNITDFLRASAGYGKITVTSGVSLSQNGTLTTTEASASTFGFGVKGMMPGWNFTPTVGLHFATISYSGTGLEVGGFKESGSHLYGTAGFDWQTKVGFNLNGGFRYSFKSGIGGGIYLGAGWFVNWLG